MLGLDMHLQAIWLESGPHTLLAPTACPTGLKSLVQLQFPLGHGALGIGLGHLMQLDHVPLQFLLQELLGVGRVS